MSHVLITGASSGLGRIVLEECLADHHDVVAVVRRPEQRDALIQEWNGRARVEVADLADPDEVEELLGVLGDERFDYALLNAGCASVGAFAELPARSVESILRTNLLSNMHLVHRLLPGALERGTKFVFVSSLSARLPGIRFASYAVSKAGLTQLYKSLAVEYPTLGFLCLEIGGVDTPFHRKAGAGARRGRKPARVVGQRLYRAMLRKEGVRTLSADWWLVRRILMSFEGGVVRLLRWSRARGA